MQPPGENQASSREGTPVSSQSGVKRSIKIPDPPVLTNGINPSWDEWLFAVRDKLESNHDHWETDRARVAYVLTRLGGRAVKQTFARRTAGTNKPYLVPDDIIDHLAPTFDDPDRKHNKRREFKALKQGQSQSFIDFYSEFMRLTSHMKRDEDTNLEDLREKVLPRLGVLWDGALVEFTTIEEVKCYLVRQDNAQRTARLLREPDSYSTKPPISKRVAFARSSPPPIARPSPFVRRPSSPSNEQRLTDSRNEACFNCYKKGYVAQDYPERPKPNANAGSGTYNPNSFQRNRGPRINQATVEDTEDVNDSDYESQSESGN